MPNFILNGAPYRTRPNFIQSRMNQMLPGPAYGDRARLTDNIVQTYKPQGWQKTSVVSKMYPDLKGLGQDNYDATAMLTNARKLIKKAADAEANEVTGLKKAIDYLMKTRNLTSDGMDSTYPELMSAWRGAGSLYGGYAAGLQEIDRLLGASGQGWSPEDTSRVNQIKDEYTKQAAALTDSQRAEAGLSADPVTWAIIGAIAIVAIIGVWRATAKPDPVQIANDKIAAINRIQNDAALTEAQKKQAITIITNAQPEESFFGKFFGSIGLALGIGVVGWFVLKSGLLGAVGARIAKGGEKRRKSSDLFETKKEREYERDILAYERDISGYKTPPRPARPSKPRKAPRGKSKPKSKFRV